MKKTIFTLGITSTSFFFLACNNDDNSIDPNNEENTKLLKEIVTKYNDSPKDTYRKLYTYNIEDSLVNKLEYFKNDTLTYIVEYNYIDKNNIVETNYSFKNYTKKIESSITHQLKDNFVKTNYEYSDFDSIKNEHSYEYMISYFPIEKISYFDQCGINKTIEKNYNFKDPSNPKIYSYAYVSKNGDCNNTDVYREDKKVGESIYIGKDVTPNSFDHFKIYKKGMFKSASYLDAQEADFNYQVDFIFDKNNLPKSSTEYYTNNPKTRTINTYSYY